MAHAFSTWWRYTLLYGGLTDLMQTEKLYTLPELTLLDLANRLGVRVRLEFYIGLQPLFSEGDRVSTLGLHP